ncbi:MAG: HAD family hydrolase [Beijerinckiaceae bacterium]
MANPTIPVFDFGGVLLDWNPLYLYRKVFNDTAKAEWFVANICTNAWNIEQDRGRSFPDAVRMLSDQHPEWAEQIAAYDKRWTETLAGAIHDSVAILETLRRQHEKVYAITNFNDEKLREAQTIYPFLNVFDDIVVSATEKVLKPEPRIFEILFERNGLRAGDCVFIDDSEKNVIGARAVGMHAIHFQNPQQLAQDLRTLGFAV